MHSVVYEGGGYTEVDGVMMSGADVAGVKVTPVSRLYVVCALLDDCVVEESNIVVVSVSLVDRLLSELPVSVDSVSGVLESSSIASEVGTRFRIVQHTHIYTCSFFSMLLKVYSICFYEVFQLQVYLNQRLKAIITFCALSEV